MDIQNTKLELISRLLNTKEERLLAKVKAVIDDEQEDWWSDMDTNEKERIKKGIEQADQGEVIDHEKVMKLFEKWH